MIDVIYALYARIHNAFMILNTTCIIMLQKCKYPDKITRAMQCKYNYITFLYQ